VTELVHFCSVLYLFLFYNNEHVGNYLLENNNLICYCLILQSMSLDRLQVPLWSLQYDLDGNWT